MERVQPQDVKIRVSSRQGDVKILGSRNNEIKFKEVTTYVIKIIPTEAIRRPNQENTCKLYADWS